MVNFRLPARVRPNSSALFLSGALKSEQVTKFVGNFGNWAGQDVTQAGCDPNQGKEIRTEATAVESTASL